MLFIHEHNIPSRISYFQIAKANVELKYSVVGIMEDFRSSLQVMAAMVPAFMGRIPWLQFGRRSLKVQDRVLFNSSMEVLKRNMSLELDFYDFVRTRLYKQVKLIENGHFNT